MPARDHPDASSGDTCGTNSLTEDPVLLGPPDEVILFTHFRRGARVVASCARGER